MENYSEQQIKKMVTAYENKRAREKKYYETVKDTEEFKIANRTRANTQKNINFSLIIII